MTDQHKRMVKTDESPEKVGKPKNVKLSIKQFQNEEMNAGFFQEFLELTKVP